MSSPTFEAVVAVLSERFHVDTALIKPDSSLQALGLDSLSLMEFVFAIEDHFAIRIPEDRLDPRQSDLTLTDLCNELNTAIQQRAATGQTS